MTDKFSETRIDDEYVVMLLDTGEFLSLAGTAGAIWSLIDGTRGRDAILAALSDEYDAPEEAIAADLDEFLATLRGNGLLAEA
ncbi:MAG: PqqD family protein [Sphingomonadaceae bacterium]